MFPLFSVMSTSYTKQEREELIISEDEDSIHKNTNEENIIELEDRLQFAYSSEDLKKLMTGWIFAPSFDYSIKIW